MIRLIVSIVLLVLLAVFISFNAQYKTDMNLFGYKMEDISVVSVVLLTLAAGVIASVSFLIKKLSLFSSLFLF